MVVVVGCGPRVEVADDASGTSEGDGPIVSSDDDGPVDPSDPVDDEGGDVEPPASCALRPIPRAPECDAAVSPIQLAQLGGESGPLAVDDRMIYIAVTQGPGALLYAIDKCGGTTIELADAGINPGHLDHSDDAVLWTDYTDEGALYSVSKTGGARTALASANHPLALVVADDLAYFSTEETLWRVPIVGGTVESVPAAGFSFVQLRWDGERVYWSADDTGGGFGYSVPSTGETAIVAPGDPGAMVVDCEHAYFTNEYGEVVRVPKSGGAVVAVAPHGFRMTQDETRVYFSDAEGSVWAIDKSTSEIALVATTVATPYHVAVDATHVYWGDLGGGVWVAPKP